MTTSLQQCQVSRDLLNIGSDLKWSAVELTRIAERLAAAGNNSDAQAVIRMIQLFKQDEARLSSLAQSLVREREELMGVQV